MIKVIIQSSENGDDEYVRLETDDIDEDVEFFAIPGCTIDQDLTIDCPELEASSFPFNYDLKRS